MQKQDLQGYGSATTSGDAATPCPRFVGVSHEDPDGNAATRALASGRTLRRAKAMSNQIATGRKQPERLKGPIKTRAELRTACGDFVREIHSCGDMEQFEALLVDRAPLIKQVQEEHEFFWLGDGGDFLGMQKEINRMRAELEQVDEHTERWRNSALAAG
jgi:hypothetical protein